MNRLVLLALEAPFERVLWFCVSGLLRFCIFKLETIARVCVPWNNVPPVLCANSRQGDRDTVTNCHQGLRPETNMLVLCLWLVEYIGFPNAYPQYPS